MLSVFKIKSSTDWETIKHTVTHFLKCFIAQNTFLWRRTNQTACGKSLEHTIFDSSCGICKIYISFHFFMSFIFKIILFLKKIQRVGIFIELCVLKFGVIQQNIARGTLDPTLVASLASGWRHLHLIQMWSPDDCLVGII